MNKKDLIDALSAKLQEDKKVHYPKWELTTIIEPALDLTLEPSRRDEEVHLNQFGRDTVKHKKGSFFYNMNTGQKELAPDKKILQFTPTKNFHFNDNTLDSPATDAPDSEET